MDKEREILGACLLYEDKLSMAVAQLKPEDFQDKKHQTLFKDIIELVRSGTKVDIVTLNEISKVDINYIAGLPETITNLKNTGEHINLLKKESTKRKILKAMSTVTLEGNKQDLSDLIDSISTKILPLANLNQEEEKDIKDQVMDSITDLENRSKGITGIKTEFHSIDKMIHGLEGGNLYMIAARPGMGKTALALNMIDKIKAKTLFFCLEMSESDLIHRIMSFKQNIDTEKMRTGQLQDYEWTDILKAGEDISNKKINIDINSSTLLKIISKIKRFKPEIVFIDYLQLINGGKHESKNYEMAYISRELKKISLEMNIPIVALAQLNRGPEARKDKRPLLSDIRDSGSLEQDFSVIMFLYRDYYYYPSSEKAITNNKGQVMGERIEIEIAKNRHGRTGKIELYFIPRYLKFAEFAKQQEVEDAS
ncbi:MAG: replicative DNA helicase, partial [Tissierellales bacterium]|jgi:replicative DNA helicase|nr:replicative DNA helicase [Tissierellales bacterium]